MSFDFLDDIHGNRSSKRLWANRMLTVGLLSKIACIVLALMIIPAAIYLLKDVNADVAIRYFDWAFDEVKELTIWLFWLGSGLLGWTIFEHIGQCISNKKKK